MLLAERDHLLLEWDLHQSRFLAFSLLESVDPGPPPDKMRIDRHIAQSFGGDVEWFRESGGLTYDELVAMQRRQWKAVPAQVEQLLNEHAVERGWMRDHHRSKPIATLRAAVRTAMVRAGGAQPAGMPPLRRDELPEDDRRTIRRLRWLLALRCELAFRRMISGELALLAREGSDRDDGPLWACGHLKQIRARCSGPFAGGYEPVRAATCEQLLQICRRREAAASAHRVTGDHREPDLLDFDRLGAGDTV